MSKMKKGDDPKDFKVDEVNDYLEAADDEELSRVLAAEAAEEGRKTILEAHGYDTSVRRDGSGRELYPWEVDPKRAAQAGRQVARETAPSGAQSPSSPVEAAGDTPQPAATPADSGTAAAPATPAENANATTA